MNLLQKLRSVFGKVFAMPRFIGYRLDGEKKIPCDPKTGKAVDCTKPTNRRSADVVWSAVEAGLIDGIGVVMDYGLCGLDLDNCVSADGTLSPLARDIVSIMDSYWEYSISGTGIHILFQSDESVKNDVINHVGGKIEVFGERKYLTFSGQYPDDDFRQIWERSKALATVLARYGSKAGGKMPATDKPSGKESRPSSVSDYQPPTIEDQLRSWKLPYGFQLEQASGEQDGEQDDMARGSTVNQPLFGGMTPVLWPMEKPSAKLACAPVADAGQVVGGEKIRGLLEAIKRDGAKEHHAEIRAALVSYKFSNSLANMALKDTKAAAQYPEGILFKLLHLLSGHTNRFRNDESSADFSLIRTLMRYTKDAEEIEAIMRSSGLRRDKYDTRRTLVGEEDGTYLSYSIQKALKQGRSHKRT